MSESIAVTGEIVERGEKAAPMTVANLLRGAKVSSMNAVCSRALSADKIVKLFALAASRTPKLMQCTPISVANAMMQCAELGIAPGTLGTAYLIPYENRRVGVVECQLIVGYRGLVELARRSGQVATITADVVREGDMFVYENGVEPTLRHQSKAPTSAKRTHAWAAVKFKDGSYQFTVLRWEEVEAIRGRSRAANAGPWVTDTDEMAKKTALRRLCKLLPLTLEVAAAMEKADKTEFDFESIAEATAQAEQSEAAGVEALKAKIAAEGVKGNVVPEGTPTVGTFVQNEGAMTAEDAAAKVAELRQNAAKSAGTPTPSSVGDSFLESLNTSEHVEPGAKGAKTTKPKTK